MAQTTTAKVRANFQVEVSTDGSTWNDISGEAASASFSGGDQLTGSQNTADGQKPVVTGADKTGPITATFNILYTPTSNQAFDRVRDRWEGSAQTIYVRYAPYGGSGTVVGNDLFTASDDAGSACLCPIVNCLPPDGDAGSGEPMMASFSVIAPDFVRGTTTT